MTKEIEAIVAAQRKTFEAIYLDYGLGFKGDDLIEYTAVFETLESELKDAFDDPDEWLLPKIKETYFDEDETIEILKGLDQDYIDDYQIEKQDADLISINLESMVLRDKLEQFLRAEIFPHFRQFEEKVNGL